MSMTISFVTVTEAELARARADADFAASVFDREDAVALDYRTLAAATEGMASVGICDDAEPTFAEEGELAYDGGYGPAMYWTSRALHGLVNSSGWQVAIHIDPRLEALHQTAAQRALCLIAVVV